MPKAITIPLSVQATPQCLDVGGRHYVAWISLVLILLPSRSTIPHFCAMSVSRSGTIVVWGKWDAQSPTLPLDSYLSQSNACGIITVMDYNHSQLSCHAICTVLFSCMWLCHLQSNCHTQTFSTFLSVIHDQMARWPLHSLPLVLYTSANLKSRVSFYSFTYRIFRSLISFGLQFCTAWHFS